MPATIIDGHQIAEKIKDEIVKDIMELNGGKRDLNSQQIKADHRPNLAIVLVGEKEDSRIYVNLKEKEAKKVGVDTHLYKIPESAGDQEIIEVIEHLNNDDTIDAILVQLPLPEGHDTDKVIESLDPAKDLDRFHSENQKELLSSCDHDHIMPPVFQVVFSILDHIGKEVKEKQVCVVSNSSVFGDGLVKVLQCQGAQAEVYGSEDPDLKTKTSQADIVITAVGTPHFLKRDMVKEGATVIDVGISKEGKKVYGDVDFEEVKEKAGYLTPVPGGVGPITIATALKNTLELYKKRS